MAYSSNIKDVIARMQASPNKVAARVKSTVNQLVHAIDTGVHERTPVHSGLAVRNMIWSVGQSSHMQEEAIAVPPDPGHTSGMGLGGEPRRAANQVAAQRTLAEMKVGRPFDLYVLDNASHHIADLEHGMLPTPQASRSPAGMFGVTVAEVLSRLRAGAGVSEIPF